MARLLRQVNNFLTCLFFWVDRDHSEGCEERQEHQIEGQVNSMDYEAMHCPLAIDVYLHHRVLQQLCTFIPNL